jgi:hypothetical protein
MEIEVTCTFKISATYKNNKKQISRQSLLQTEVHLTIPVVSGGLENG